FYQLLALVAFQVNVEAPQTVQVLEYRLARFAQRTTVMPAMPQGQRAIAAAVDTPDLHVGFAVAQVVLGGEGFAQVAIAAVIMDGTDLQTVLLVIVEHAEQAQVTHDFG